MSDSFEVKEEIKDEWSTGNEDFRLVHLGFGPAQLQIKSALKADGDWMRETPCYVYADLCHRIFQLLRERDAWRDTAEQNQRNSDFYRTLVVDCGETIGKEAYVQDDGGVCDDVLCLKVPKLVKQLVGNKHNEGER